jgi:Fe2+ or Zn2+ uptake regulation protein
MNTIKDVEILKALLPQGSHSIYKLKDELKESYPKANYSTLWRKIKGLNKFGLLNTREGTRKNGTIDRRDTKNIELSVKGLIFLIQKANLNEHEIQQLVNRFLSVPKYQTFNIIKAQIGRQAPIDALTKSFEQIRSRINLEYYDEEYATDLVVSLITKNLIDEIIRLKGSSLEKGRMSQARARQDLERLLDDPKTVEIYSKMRDELERELINIQQRKGLIDGILSYRDMNKIKEGVKP